MSRSKNYPPFYKFIQLFAPHASPSLPSYNEKLNDEKKGSLSINRRGLVLCLGESRVTSDLKRTPRGHDSWYDVQWEEGGPEKKLARKTRFYPHRGPPRRLFILFSEGKVWFMSVGPGGKIIVLVPRNEAGWLLISRRSTIIIGNGTRHDWEGEEK